MLTARAVSAERQAPHDIDPVFAELRQREFARLDRAGHAYLDYTGSALYAERQIRRHGALLLDATFGNPHAESEASRASSQALDLGRSLLLAHLDADPGEYTVCFTANASAAIKLVGESYPFGGDSACVLTADNHNSVNGIREYARRSGARVAYLALDDELRLVGAIDGLRCEASRSNGPKLFALPAQSNFSGVRHPLSLVAAAQELDYDVLLDAASLVSCRGLSLRTTRPEFVALSFYKLFGYPTGLGALVARCDALARLARPWFAGGTVDYASVQNDLHALRSGADGFEDGTPNFLGVSALPDGFALLAEVGMARLSAHASRLTSLLLDGLRGLTHRDGSSLVRHYGPADTDDRGGTVAFNLVDRERRVIPYWVVESRARARGVSLRGGCFCNPGASEAAFRFDAATTGRCLRTGGFTIERFAACMQDAGADVAVGALRASVGMANNEADVRRAIDVMAEFAH
jgi:selenocysteine lyase/cysteine desulfurase